MVENKIKEIEDLIKIISKLPGLGKKSSSRIVLKLINNREELMKNLNVDKEENEIFHDSRGDVKYTAKCF